MPNSRKRSVHKPIGDLMVAASSNFIESVVIKQNEKFHTKNNNCRHEAGTRGHVGEKVSQTWWPGCHLYCHTVHGRSF